MDSTEIYQEGLRLGPTKVWSADGPEQGIVELIRRNSRVPKAIRGDLNAQIVACRTGERELAKLYQRFGIDVVRQSAEQIFTQSQRADRDCVAAMPDGTWVRRGRLGLVGPGGRPGPGTRGGVDRRRRCASTCAARRRRHPAVVNWGWPNDRRGTPGVQVRRQPGPAGHRRLRSATSPSSPTSAQCSTPAARRVPVLLPAPRADDRPVPQGDSGAVPDPGRRRPTQRRDEHPVHRPPRRRKVFISGEATAVGWGAWSGRRRFQRPDRLRRRRPRRTCPSRSEEGAHPLRVDRYALRADSGGLGRSRGGLGVERGLRSVADERGPVHLVERTTTPGWGLDGGAAGEALHGRARAARRLDDLAAQVGWSSPPDGEPASRCAPAAAAGSATRGNGPRPTSPMTSPTGTHQLADPSTSTTRRGNMMLSRRRGTRATLTITALVLLAASRAGGGRYRERIRGAPASERHDPRRVLQRRRDTDARSGDRLQLGRPGVRPQRLRGVARVRSGEHRAAPGLGRVVGGVRGWVDLHVRPAPGRDVPRRHRARCRGRRRLVGAHPDRQPGPGDADGQLGHDHRRRPEHRRDHPHRARTASSSASSRSWRSRPPSRSPRTATSGSPPTRTAPVRTNSSAGTATRRSTSSPTTAIGRRSNREPRPKSCCASTRTSPRRCSCSASGEVDMMAPSGPTRRSKRSRWTASRSSSSRPSRCACSRSTSPRRRSTIPWCARRSPGLRLPGDGRLLQRLGVIPQGPLPSGCCPGIRRPADGAGPRASARVARRGRPPGRGVLRDVPRPRRTVLQEFAGNVLQEQLGELGITVEQQLVPWPQMVEIQSNPDTAAGISFLNQSAFTNDPTYLLRSAYSSATHADKAGTTGRITPIPTSTGCSTRLAPRPTTPPRQPC